MSPKAQMKRVHDSPEFINAGRRTFLKVIPAAGAGLVIGIYLSDVESLLAASPAAVFKPNVWLKIAPDNTITVMIARSEMGQGVRTSLPMLVAEDLEADWSTVRIEAALADKAQYGDQSTGGSESIRSLFEPLRKAGATAREMLVAAAAQQWKVPAAECRAAKSAVTHTPSGRKLTYGALAEAAAKLPAPKEVNLKDPKDFRILGKPMKRLDTPGKVSGAAQYGIDVKVPGMLYAVIARCPVFGGKVARFDGTKAKAVRGVRDVVKITESSVAVIADSTWAAISGRKALDVTWDEGPNAAVTSDSIRKMFQELGEKGGVAWRNDGDAEKALAAAAKRISVVYEVPFLAHAPMEPMNCTADVRNGSVEMWAPTQVPQDVQAAVGKAIGVDPDSIKLHITLMGGGFGRRLSDDYGVEAALASKAAGAPVKVQWTREDDMTGGYYRPASYHRLSGAIGADGWPVAYTHQVVAPSILEQLYPGAVKAGSADPVVAGQTPYLYATPNVKLESVMANTHVPPGWWRSVYVSQCAFATEGFVDELAVAAGKDPYEFRRHLLAGDRVMKVRNDTFETARLRGVLELAATKAGWGKPLPKGHARGIACYPSFGSYAAQVAEVSVADGEVRVHRMVCAVDCGIVVNPDTIEAQMQGSVAFALTAALKASLSIAGGRVQESNFNDYPILRINEMPVVEAHLVKSTAAPGGVGEPGVGPVAPAVVNAVFALTGKRIRRLPIRAEDFS